MNRDITSPVYDFLFQKENKKIQEAKRKCEKQLYSKIQKEEAQKQKKFKKFQEQKSFINLLSKISPLKEDKNPKWVVNVHKTKEFTNFQQSHLGQYTSPLFDGFDIPLMPPCGLHFILVHHRYL